jgi:CSLREA domain-containing protein
MKTIFERCTLTVFTFGVLFIAVMTADAATFSVNTTTDTQDAVAGNGICADSGGNCSLRAAITEANALAGADVINLPAGTYTETLVSADDNTNFGGDFDITSDIQIIGTGAAATIVQANAAPGVATERVFHIRGALTTTSLNVLIEGVTIQNGRYAVSNLGAGVRVDQGTNHNVRFTRSTFTNNRLEGSGGGLSVSETITPTIHITDCTFSNNNSGVINPAVSGETGGAGIHIGSASTVNITDSFIQFNDAVTSQVLSGGGGVGVTGNNVTMTIHQTVISNNTNRYAGGLGRPVGGGIFFRSGNLNVTNSIIRANSATGFGGGIAFWSNTTNSGTVNLTDSVIADNRLSFNPNGGGAAGIDVNEIGNGLMNLNILRCTVSGNIGETGSIAGGLENQSAQSGSTFVNITDSDFSGNRGDSSGAITNRTSGNNNATMTIRGTTLRNNVSASDGGGIRNRDDSALPGLAIVNITNSTISGNSAEFTGGGISNGQAGSTVNLNYCTVASNTAGERGGGLRSLGVFNIKNTIIADNSSTTGPDISGTITSQNYNHIKNITGGVFFANTANNLESQSVFFALPGDVTGIDPLLTPLANNGGTMLTHLPLLTSPVLNTIPNGVSDCGTTVLTSQNRVTRPQGAGCEKGSTERLVPIAATAFVRGRLLTPTGRGLTNAFVVLTNTNTGEVRYARSTTFGYFTLRNLPTDNFYTINVSSKSYRFTGQSITLSQDLDGLVLNANN